MMLGSLVACSSDASVGQLVGNGNGTVRQCRQLLMYGGLRGSIKTCDHLLFDAYKSENTKGTVIGNGDQEFIFKGTQTLSKGTYLMKGWIYVGTGRIDHRTGDCYQRG